MRHVGERLLIQRREQPARGPAQKGMEVSLAELESMAVSAGLDSLVADKALSTTMWVRFEANVRSAHAAAAKLLREQGTFELVRLLDQEEQTRCQAFQGVLMGEVQPPVYQSTVRSILEKLLAKLETCSYEPSIYRGSAQCLSEYMSALNHHCDTCAAPAALEPPERLDAIAEAAGECEFYDSASIASNESSRSASSRSASISSSLDTAHACAAAIMGAGTRAGPSMDGTRAPLANTMMVGIGVGAAATSEELRKQRRRESNRSASIKYRSKKTATLSTLMADNANLRSQLASMSSQNAVLTAENKLLKQQVSFMQGIFQGRRGDSPDVGSDDAGAVLYGAEGMTPAPASATPDPRSPPPMVVEPPALLPLDPLDLFYSTDK